MIRELIDTEVEAVVGGRKHETFHFNNVRLTNRETVTAKARGDNSTAIASGGDQTNSIDLGGVSFG